MDFIFYWVELCVRTFAYLGGFFTLAEIQNPLMKNKFFPLKAGILSVDSTEYFSQVSLKALFSKIKNVKRNGVRNMLLSLLLLIITGMIQHAHAEFEGYITYKVVAVPLSDGIKKGVLYKHMGKTHTFYFKNGMHKWLNKKGEFKSEIYNPNIDSNYIYTDYYTHDTIYKSSVLKDQDSLYDFDEEESVVVMGRICHGATVRFLNKRNKESLIRTWYCPSTGTEINPAHYAHYKMMGTHKLVEHFKSLPYCIFIQYPRQGYAFIYTAEAVIPMKLDDSVFEYDKNKIIKLNYE